jgi:lipopolysaccharide/colanic/teichoic acid biosynthesis glycosyltransferase
MTAHYRKFPPSLDEIIATTDLKTRIKPKKSLYRNGLKRFLDIMVVSLSLPFVIPIIAILAVLVARDGGKPFYFQDRIGRGGQLYRIWKLRTMVKDADTHLVAHLETNADAKAEWDETQKLKDDPRITRFGRFLRKSSLDELPQLFNVLLGDMSLVGPRPMMTDQSSLYPGLAYYDLRPGITGYWQISDRNETAFSERAFYDTRYNADLSLLTDIKILRATVDVVVRGTGY